MVNQELVTQLITKINTILSRKANSADLADVATSGSYNDLKNIPTQFPPSSHTHGNITNDGKAGNVENKPLITTTNGLISTGDFESSANNINMDGTASAGSTNKFARADHIHPSDTSRAPESHASTDSTYGLGSTTAYGHCKTVNDLNTASHSNGNALSAYQGKVLKDAVDGKANIIHSQASNTITDANTYSNIGNTANTQESINAAINEKIVAANIQIVDDITDVEENGIYLIIPEVE